MARLSATLDEAVPTQGAWPPHAAGALVVALIAFACAMAPVGMAVAVVALGAGPHNWCEARYLLSRMPARWGPLRQYFVTGIGGVVALTAAYIALTWAGSSADIVWLALWHTALIGWIALLVMLRRQQPPRRDWLWLVPPGLLCLAAAWAQPVWTSVALMFLHPLLALAFLDRELSIRRLPWHDAYRTTLLLVPILIVGIWVTNRQPTFALRATADEPAIGNRQPAVQADPSAGRAGPPGPADGGWDAATLAGVPGTGPTVLAAHVFLESLHYIAWIVAIPLATGAVPWRLRRVPLAARSVQWRRLVTFALAAGLGLVVILWIAFAIDYELTRQVYFTLAIAHVLAEVPFLIRLL